MITDFIKCSIIVVLAIFSLNIFAQQAAYKDPKLPVEKRVADLLSKMTVEEKVAQLISCTFATRSAL